MRARLALLSLVCCIPLAAHTGGTARPNVEPGLQRFLTRPHEPVTQYRAHRTLEGHNARFNAHGALEAITELMPSGQFTYSIVSQRGSEYIRDRLRQLLETEAKAIESGDASRSALTAENYELGAAEPAGPGFVKLLAKPRRKDLSLIDGVVFITSDGGDLVRFEGRMAKNPSFWTSKVYLVRHYERVGGVRVLVRLDSTAHIKMAGEAKMSMVYRYDMINGALVTQ